MMSVFLTLCAELLRIILSITYPFSDKVLDVLYGIFMGNTVPLPPINDRLLLYSATELASKIRKREVQAQSVMEAYVKRIKQIQPVINAVVDQRYIRAMQDAVQVDRQLYKSEKSIDTIEAETPLLGVPFTCKESVGVKDMAMTQGLVQYKDRKAPEDSEVVTLLRKAGAIPVTVTNVPVNCMWWESANHVFGMTKNPYDNRRTVGGSSGGEGALITSAGAVFGVGSDLAGSIRIPASFCGIYGHKPSKGIISNQCPWPLTLENEDNIEMYVTTGPMCRYARDLILLTEIMTGGEINLRQKVDFRHVKVYYMLELPSFLLRATSEVKAAVKEAAKHFEKKFGVTATNLKIKELRDAYTIWECKLLETENVSFRTLLSGDEGINLGKEFLKSLFHDSDYTWPALYYAAVERREKNKNYRKYLEKFEILKEKFENIFKEDAILLLPTHPEPPPHYLTTIPKNPNVGYTCIFNILGYPSTQIPARVSNGLPIGIQAVSSRNRDHLTLAAAIELDRVFRGWVSPCNISA